MTRDRARPLTRPARLVIAAGCLAVLVAHLATGYAWSLPLAAAAAAIAALALVPGLSWLVRPVGTYLVIWIVFNLLRAGADDTFWANATLGLVPRMEAWLAGGQLPSRALQRAFSEPASIGRLDHASTTIYLSFFIVPHLVGELLLWRDRRSFWRLVGATVTLFALALAGFFLVPTSPPWLVAESVPEIGFGHVRRITEDVLREWDLPVRLFGNADGGGVRASQVRLEPNPVAAMPSIHFAVTALVGVVAWRSGPWRAGAAFIYTCLMGISLVYLGEHYVLDLVAGGLLAGAGWVVAGQVIGALDPRLAGKEGR